MRALAVVLVLSLGSPVLAWSQSPVCGPIDLRAPIPGPERTQILVLASQHLRRIESLDRATLGPLLDALQAWKPAAIGVETLPPAVIAAMESRPVYEPVLEAFASEALAGGRLARAHLGITWPEAVQAADSLYGELEVALPGQRFALRRDLVPLLLAAYDIDNAALQWSYIAGKPGTDESTLPDTLRSLVEERLQAPNETVAIGIALARRLELARVHPIDDHLETDLFLAIADDLVSELEGSEAYRELVGSGALEESERELREAHVTGDLLPFYRSINTPGVLERGVDLEWRFFFRTRMPSGLDRY